MSNNEQRWEEPNDRKTRLANHAAQLVSEHPEWRESDRCIVTVLDDVGGGIGLFGFETDTDAMVDLFVMLRAIARANGKDLEYVAIPESPGDMTA